MEKTWMPDRKVLAGGIAGIVAWCVMLAMEKFGGVKIDPSLQPAMASLVGTAMAYIVPPSQRDILKRLNDDIVKVAQDDPNIPVTKP